MHDKAQTLAQTQLELETAPVVEEAEEIGHAVCTSKTVCKTIHNQHMPESTQRNLSWAVLQKGVVGRKLGLEENQAIFGPDFKIQMLLTFRNQLKCNQAAQKQLLVI